MRKRLATTKRRVALGASVVALVFACIVIYVHKQQLREEAALSAAAGGAVPPSYEQVHGDASATSPPILKSDVVSVRQDDDKRAVQCVAAKKNVLLAGNRPVGTYLCAYFPTAKAHASGCVIPCRPKHPMSRENGVEGSFTCTIVNMGSRAQLKSADVVVNHHGPVPTKFSLLEPTLTVFYSGESNISEGKKSFQSYQEKYDVAVSFHQHRPLYFTWTNRFTQDFEAALTGQLQKGWPEWSERRNAVAIFVSRCKKGGREAVIQALSKHYPVHSFGKCHRTHSIEQEFPACAALAGGRYPQKLCVFRQYKYILALDNSREKDYVTEKVYHALIAGALPIYDGAPNADVFLPGGWPSIVRLSDFDANGAGVDYSALAEKLRELQDPASPELGTKRLWSSAKSEHDWGHGFVENLHHEEPTCELCDAARWKRCLGG